MRWSDNLYCGWREIWTSVQKVAQLPAENSVTRFCNELKCQSLFQLQECLGFNSNDRPRAVQTGLRMPESEWNPSRMYVECENRKWVDWKDPFFGLGGARSSQKVAKKQVLEASEVHYVKIMRSQKQFWPNRPFFRLGSCRTPQKKAQKTSFGSFWGSLCQ